MCKFGARVVAAAAITAALFAAVAATGCGSSGDSADQQAALDRARREGAQTARQEARIRDLRQQVREVKQAQRDEANTVGAAATPSTQPASGQPLSSYVPSYQPYTPSDPEYFYLAEIPTGGGWSAPVESYPTGGELLRTSMRGPDGTLLIIDYTPNETPQLGGSYDVASTSTQTNFGPATEYIFSESESLPECNGRPCADFLINDGAGGGWGVLGGGPSLAVAEGIASHVAQSISYGD